MDVPPRVLLTGATGFIGRRAVSSLIETHRIRVLTRRESSLEHHDRLEVVRILGLGTAARTAGLFRDVGLVVHLASVVHRRDASADELSEVNVDATRRIAEAAAAAGVAHFIFLSSIAAVGRGDGRAIDEEAAPRPITSYGESKLRAEQALFRVAAQSAMVASVLRPPMVYGPGMKGNPLRLFRALDRHLPLPLAGARNRRSSLFVENLVAGILRLAARTPAQSAVYHIADREVVSTEEFARASADALGVRALLLPSPYALLRLGARIGELVPVVARLGITPALAESVGGSLVLDTSRFERATGFTPPYSQHDGLAATARWFRTSRD